MPPFQIRRLKVFATSRTYLSVKDSIIKNAPQEAEFQGYLTEKDLRIA